MIKEQKSIFGAKASTEDIVGMDYLNNKEITGLISMLTKGDLPLTVIRLNGILDRIDEGMLSEFDIANILTFTPVTEITLWGELQKSTLELLESNIERCVQIFNVGASNFGLPLYIVKQDKEGSDHNPIFKTSVSIFHMEQTFVSTPAFNRSKKTSLNLALLSLLGKMCNQSIEIDVISSAKEGNENYKGLVSELCHKWQVVLPKFEIIVVGEVPCTGFLCEASVTIEEKLYSITTSDTQTTKKAAEQKAARELLALLPKPVSPVVSPAEASKEPLLEEKTNYKGVLNNISQLHAVLPPVYKTVRDKNGFTSTVTLGIEKQQYTNDSPFIARTLKAAEQIAAKQLLDLLPTEFKETNSQEKKPNYYEGNPVSSLTNEFASLPGDQTPIYQFELRGLIFRCLCNVGGKIYEAEGNSKKKAKRLAALAACKDLLGKVERDVLLD